MQDYLADKLKQSLGARFTLVDAPGTGVLVVDAAFTTLQSNRLTIDQSSDNPNADVTHTFGIGRAGILITLKDGATDAVLATLSDEETGQSLANNPHTDTTWGRRHGVLPRVGSRPRGRSEGALSRGRPSTGSG